MLKPKYISPSSLSLFEKDPGLYYMRYFMGASGDRTSPAMACGTGFDCFVKSYISEGTFDLEAELVRGCTDRRRSGEVRLLDWCRESGSFVFERYKACGALGSLLDMAKKRVGAIRFESGVTADVCGVPVYGKPDMFWATPDGLVILDWKVNGVLGKNGISPNKGFAREWPSGKRHKASLTTLGDLAFMEDLNVSWADQLGIYALSLLGTPSEAAQCKYVIDQTCGTGVPVAGSRTLMVPAVGESVAFANVAGEVPFLFPELRFARFECRISEEYLTRICERLVAMWKVVSFGPEHSLFDRGRAIDAVRSNKDVGFLF